jgi:GntR family transcriptional repressor for pyruvate dehydrogenase complex
MPTPDTDSEVAVAAFGAVRRVRSFEEIVQQIQDAIASGRLRPGERLPSERDLCDVFGVSRATLREALRALEALGVVEVRTGARGGAFAVEPGEDVVGSALASLLRFRQATARDLVEFRVSFEGENAAWAARRASAEDVAELEALATRIEAAVASGQPWRSVVELDVAFHVRVARATGNVVRGAIMLAIQDALRRAVIETDPIVDPAVRSTMGAEAHAIAEAIATRNEHAARARMRAHVERWSLLEVEAADRAG